jgi:ABC-type glutathione transport system ATPase component
MSGNLIAVLATTHWVAMRSSAARAALVLNAGKIAAAYTY